VRALTVLSNSVLWDATCSPAFSAFASGFTSPVVSPPYLSPTVDGKLVYPRDGGTNAHVYDHHSI
jgi:hypothetical protein